VQILLSLLVLLITVAFLVSIGMLFFAHYRRRGAYCVAGTLVGLIIVGTIGAGIDNRKAQELGWPDRKTMSEAAVLGITTPSDWQAFQIALDAKKQAAFKAKREEMLADEQNVGLQKHPPANAAMTASIEKVDPLDELSVSTKQAEFVRNIVAAREAFDSASTEMQEGATRPSRSKALCAALPSGSMDRWIGTVEELTTNGDGRGVISISIGDEIRVKTWNNALSDLVSKTLVAPGTALYNSMLGLAVGDEVVFSGSLIKGGADCFQESSVTLRGSMTAPEFISQFRQIEKRP
jgi:hypothetical protein